MSGKLMNDGGAAFPIQESIISQGSEGVPASSGMSLRDYFAAKVLQGEMACQSPQTGEWEASKYPLLAERCYSIADAMLKARER